MPIAAARPFTSLARRKRLRVVIARGDNIRAFTIRPWLAGAVCLAAGLFGVLYLTATGYLVFRDDILAASIARQTRMQHAYEDRIAALRADIDRLTSRQLLNQEAFDAKMDQLVGRQAALDARQDLIAGLSQAARGAGIAPAPAGLGGTASPEARLDADGLPQKTSSAEPLDDGAPVGEATLRVGTIDDALPSSSESVKIGAVESSVEELARAQVDYVGRIAGEVGGRADKVAAILKPLGYQPPKTDDSEDGVGGPFIPLADNADPETFRSSIALVTGEIDQLAEMRRFADKLPLAKPITDGVMTSGFGPRLDPFLHRPAMHPGIDFRAQLGDPVHATAAGTVIAAGMTGGYGRMVEIDHGNGVTTRFGHLSEILVTIGQVVHEGTLIGRTGNTGRSTGPHLHYEVRVDGQAIDPMRYIRAGGALAALL